MLHYDSTYTKIGDVARVMRGHVEIAGVRANHHKYVEKPGLWYKKARLFVETNQIKPGSRVFDIGPGAGYFLYILKTELGCDVSGVDRPFPFFSTCRELLGIDSVVVERIHRRSPIKALNGLYDYITAFGACFDCSLLERIWDEEAYRFWFNDVVEHLNPGGQLITVWNAPTLWPMVSNLPFKLKEWNHFVYSKPE